MYHFRCVWEPILKSFEYINRCPNDDVKVNLNQHTVTLIKESHTFLSQVVPFPLFRVCSSLHIPVGPSTPSLESLEDTHTWGYFIDEPYIGPTHILNIGLLLR